MHALYRFYDVADDLLYIGVTHDPGARWASHRKDKPWWHEVTRISVETHPSRTAVLEAERTAILAEQPRYNVVHNRRTATGQQVSTPQLDRLSPIQAGDWIALGLVDGRCPVGEVVAVDDTWVSVRLKDFMWGGLTNHIVAERWDTVGRVELAYPEDAQEDGGHPRLMDDEHLGEFQTAWERAHLGDTHEKVDQARRDYRQEQRHQEQMLRREERANGLRGLT